MMSMIVYPEAESKTKFIFNPTGCHWIDNIVITDLEKNEIRVIHMLKVGFPSILIH
jgi:hypothetical protein